MQRLSCRDLVARAARSRRAVHLIRLRRLTVTTSAVLIAPSLLSAVAASAGKPAGPVRPQQSGPFWPGNLLNMNNADFEDGVGDWRASSNVASLTTSTTAFLHNSGLKIVAADAGTSVIKLTGPRGIQINLKGGEYRVGAYIKMEAGSGHATEFGLGCFDSGGRWLGWSTGRPVTNNGTGAWQWVEDDITVPPGCAYVAGSPQVAFTHMRAGGTVYMDEVWFAPYRAALIIGAYAPDAKTWSGDNRTVGPLQSIKTFYGPGQDLPPSWPGTSSDRNTCANVEKNYPGDYSKWPVCLIAFMRQQNESQIRQFLRGMPPQQTVIFIYHQEPEGDSFPSPGGSCDPGATSADEFKCEFERQAGYVRAAAAGLGLTENVFTAEDSASSQYKDNGPGDGCAWIVPSSYVDFYLVDHYEHGWADGSNLSVESGSPGKSQQWNNWLGCVRASAKPIGLGEYGLCSGGNYCRNEACSDSASTMSDEKTMAADHNYLESEPSGTAPTLLWEYWYAKCWQFSNKNGGIAEWHAVENANGGSVGG